MFVFDPLLYSVSALLACARCYCPSVSNMQNTQYIFPYYQSQILTDTTHRVITHIIHQFTKNILPYYQTSSLPENHFWHLTQKERRADRARCTQATLFPYDCGGLRAKTRFEPVSGAHGPKRVSGNGQKRPSATR